MVAINLSENLIVGDIHYIQVTAFIFQELAKAMLVNRLGHHCPHLNDAMTRTVKEKTLAEICVHFSVIREQLPETKLMLPFIQLMKNPTLMQVSQPP